MNKFLSVSGISTVAIYQTPPQVCQLVDEYLGCRRFWQRFFTASLRDIEWGGRLGLRGNWLNERNWYPQWSPTNLLQ